jgi:hypothetical protein
MEKDLLDNPASLRSRAVSLDALQVLVAQFFMHFLLFNLLRVKGCNLFMHLHVEVRVVAVLSYEFIKRFVHFALILLLIDLVDPSVESLGQKCVDVDIVLFMIDEIPAHVLPQAVNALFVQSRGQTQSDRMRDVMHHLLSLLLEIFLS